MMSSILCSVYLYIRAAHCKLSGPLSGVLQGFNFVHLEENKNNTKLRIFQVSSFTFQSSATSLASGSSGLGAESKAWEENY